MATSGKGAKSQKAAAKKNGKVASDADAGPKVTGVPKTRSAGPETATGQQIAWKSGAQEVPSGDDRGSKVETVGGDPTPTLEGGDAPRGLQAEDALFVSNGQVASDMVPTPTGLQPIGSVAASPEEAQTMIDKRKEDHLAYVAGTAKLDELDEPTINRLGKTELRAIGLQRGYKMPDSGTRAMRAAFLAEQGKDERVGKEEED